MTTSKTAVFHCAGRPLEIVQLPVPELHPGEILVRNEMTTLCRSDLNTYCGKRLEPTPTILGHEIIGRVAQLGPDGPEVDLRGEKLSIGNRITWAIFASDPCSQMSLRGMPQKSAGRFKYGHELLTRDSSLHGGLSEYTILRPHTPFIKINQQVPIQAAAIINCAMATVAGSLRVAGDIRGKSVLVSGAGMLGVLACAMASRMGASRVGAMDIDSTRLEIAGKFGADFTVQVPNDVETASAIDWKGAGGIDVVIEVSGVPWAMEQTIEKLAIGGVAVWVGATYPQRPVVISGEHVVRNLISVRGLHNYNVEDFRAAVEFVELHHHRLAIHELIHDPFTLEEADKAFEYGIQQNPFRVGIHL